jgi:hypothetical protein
VLAEFTCDSLEKLMRERPELACRLLCNLARYLAGDVRDLTRRLCNFIDQESALAPLR